MNISVDVDASASTHCHGERRRDKPHANPTTIPDISPPTKISAATHIRKITPSAIA
jgi:hypothetical protein